MPEQFTITPENVTVEQIEQELYHVGMSEKFGFLLWILRNQTDGRYLIFCNTKAATERLDHLLNANGFKAAAITGDLPQKKRMKVLNQFKDGIMPILVATSVASRGLHIDGVTHVINYDIPEDPEDYVHRIGRTARAGAVGKAITLACEKYVHALADVEDYIKQPVPALSLTDEMIVKDYRKVRLYPKKRGPVSHKKKHESSGQGKRGSDKRKRPPTRKLRGDKKRITKAGSPKPQ